MRNTEGQQNDSKQKSLGNKPVASMSLEELVKKNEELNEKNEELNLAIGAANKLAEEEHKDVVRLTKENRVLRDKSSVTAEVHLPVRPSTR